MPARPRRWRAAAAVVLALLVSSLAATASPAHAEELRHLRGTVTGAGSEIGEVHLELYREINGAWEPYDDEYSPPAFDLQVPDGRYLLRVEEELGPYWAPHSPTWYGGPEMAQATPIVVAGADVDLEPIRLAERTDVRGVVRNASGAPVPELRSRG